VDTKISRYHWILAVSMLALPFQNCSVYQSPQRKLLEEKGIHFLGATCEPFISPASLIQIYEVDAASFIDIVPGENFSGKTCKISVPGAPTDALGVISCYFSTNARPDFAQWLSGAYSGSTRTLPTDWTFPALETGEAAADRRFMNLASQDSQHRVAEGYLRLINNSPDASVMGVGAFRSSGSLIVQCSIALKSSDLSRSVPRLQACLNWNVTSGATPPDTISVKDEAQCLLEKVVDLFVEQTL
jgi:hypothetical protein